MSTAYDSVESIPCSACGIQFACRESLVAHYGSELHSRNQERLLNGLNPLTRVKMKREQGKIVWLLLAYLRFLKEPPINIVSYNLDLRKHVRYGDPD